MRLYRVRFYLVADLDLDDAPLADQATTEEIGAYAAAELRSHLESAFDLVAVHVTVLTEPPTTTE